MEKQKVIAIDGPSGSGKSTIAQIVAKNLKFTYLDTGAMFRALGYMIQKDEINFNSDVTSLTNYLNHLDFEYGVDEDILIRINGINLTEIIRQHEVSKLASMVSQVGAIRTFLKEKQREIAKKRPSVLEGRDIGTVIFPNAALKIFLTANALVRAKRRFKELCEKDPTNADKYSVDSILKDIEARDYQDQNREIAPLVKASDAIEIDTSDATIPEVAELIISEYNKVKNHF